MTDAISAAEQLIVDAALGVKDRSTTLADAAKSVGLTVDQFRARLGELLALSNRFKVSPLTMETRYALQAVQQIAPMVEAELAPVVAAGGGLAVTEASTGLLGTAAAWLGISASTLVIGALVIGAAVVAGVVYVKTRTTHAGAPTEVEAVETPPEPCPPNVMEARLCPWTPKSAAAKPCGPGFCFDGGFNGSLSCKQQALPENAERIDLSGVKCKHGFTEHRDRCTNVVAECVSAKS